MRPGFATITCYPINEFISRFLKTTVFFYCSLIFFLLIVVLPTITIETFFFKMKKVHMVFFSRETLLSAMFPAEFFSFTLLFFTDFVSTIAFMGLVVGGKRHQNLSNAYLVNKCCFHKLDLLLIEDSV